MIRIKEAHIRILNSFMPNQSGLRNSLTQSFVESEESEEDDEENFKNCVETNEEDINTNVHRSINTSVENKHAPKAFYIKPTKLENTNKQISDQTQTIMKKSKVNFVYFVFNF